MRSFSATSLLPTTILLAGWATVYLYVHAAKDECTSDADCVVFFRGCRLDNDPDDPPVCACDARAGFIGDSFQECEGMSDSNPCLCAGCLPDSNYECIGYAAVCQQGKCSLEDTSVSVDSSSCGSDDQCELFSDYCGGCNCRAKPTGVSVPPCPPDQPTVSCFVDPCDPSVFDFAPFCVGTDCAAASPSSSVCKTPRSSCMNDGNWRECKDLEDGGCQDIAIKESCPLQFACNDNAESDGLVPFNTDDRNSCKGNKLTAAGLTELEIGEAICAQTRGIPQSRTGAGGMWYQFGLVAPGTLHLLEVDYRLSTPSVKMVWSALDNAGAFAVGDKVKLMADGNLALLDGAGDMVWDTGCIGDNRRNRLVLPRVKVRPGKDSAVIKLKAKGRRKKWIIKQSGKVRNTCD